jgi:S1-C subfamily serine protease
MAWNRARGSPSNRWMPTVLLGKAGFEKDDVILDVNNMPVQGVEGFVALIKALPPHQQALLKALDHRTGQNGYVQVTIG